MLSTQLKQLSEKLNWQKAAAEDLIYGEYNGFRFTLLEGMGFKAVFTPVAGIAPEALESLKVWLSDHKKDLKLRNFELADNFLVVRLQEAWKPRTTEQLEHTLGLLADTLKNQAVQGSTCVICGQPAEKQGLLQGLFCALHPECLDQETVDYTVNATQDEPSGQEASEQETPL